MLNSKQKLLKRQIGLFNAEHTLEADVALCETMQALTIVSKLTGITKATSIRQRAPEAAKALIIARHALEIAADFLTDQYPPVRIERISTDYAEYAKNFGKAGYYPDPRD
jgi:hypothetical protein